MDPGLNEACATRVVKDTCMLEAHASRGSEGRHPRKNFFNQVCKNHPGSYLRL